jgi:Type IV secretion system pilin
MNFITKKMVVIALLVLVGILAINFTKVAAFNPFSGPCSNSGASKSTVCQTTNTTSPLLGPGGVLTKIVNIVSVVGGIVAVIFLIIAGIEFVSSGGDPQRIDTAKNTIIYVIVGIVVIAVAQIIVNFVLYNIAQKGTVN